MDPKDEAISMGQLSDEEREALEDAGEPGFEAAADDVVDDKAGADPEPAAEPAAEKAAAAAAPAPKDKAAEPEASAAPVKADEAGAADLSPDDDAAADASGFLPQFRVDPARVGAIDSRINEITARQTALRAKLNEGEIDIAEWSAENDSLMNERSDLRAEQMSIKDKLAFNADLPRQAWESDQARFFASDRNKLFRESEDPVMYDALNAQVKILGKKYVEAGKNVSGAAILNEARDLLVKRFGLGGAPASAKAADADPKAAAAAVEAAARARAEASNKRRAAVPKTLSDVPAAAADDPETGADEFAELDAMLGDPERAFEAEVALARMSPEKQRRFGMVGSR